MADYRHGFNGKAGRRFERAPLVGRIEVWRAGRGGGWKLVRAPRQPQPLAAVRLALGDDDIIRWTPERGAPVVLARDASRLESFTAAPPVAPPEKVIKLTNFAGSP